MTISHDIQGQRFWVAVGKYHAVLMYARVGERIDFYHIYVPDPYRGRGHAVGLLKAGFEWTKQEGLHVIVSCPFISGEFLTRFKGYNHLIEDGKFVFADN